MENNERYLELTELLAYWGVQLAKRLDQERHEFQPQIYEALNSLSHFQQEMARLLGLTNPQEITRYIEHKLAGQLRNYHELF